MRRAKIVCTLGPATSSYERILELVHAGMDVARINLSHGTHEQASEALAHVRHAAQETGRAIAVLADLQGPKIRLGNFSEGEHILKEGDRFTITVEDVLGDAQRASTTYKGLTQDVAAGDPLLIDDGNVRLRAIEVNLTDVITLVEIGGRVSNHKGINLPGAHVAVPALSEKDIDDLRWALRSGVDFVALSFVRDPDDIIGVHRIMDEEGIRLPVIAKIEKPQAIEHIDEIIDAFDGLMVARGDLGVELPLEDVPLVQKAIIEKARKNAKPVIVATQMLESMISAPRPTRAEASDVANAVLDGADAVMLSGETSVGRYPVDTVKIMARIVESTEDHGLPRMAEFTWKPKTHKGIICRAAADVAVAAEAELLVAFTTTGDSARRIARYRTHIPIIALSPYESVRNQLALTWGVQTFLVEAVKHTDAMVVQVDKALTGMGTLEEGSKVVIVAGSPPGIPGSTNALRLHRLGAAISATAPGYAEDLEN
ncbi:MAG: pyruvate kinase [Aeromicrobium sp.]|nr:MAG: pyruvate kinase [Aeromicrobium sp.]